jgi:hypothetical protein
LIQRKVLAGQSPHIGATVREDAMTASLNWLKSPVVALRDWVEDYRKWNLFIDELEAAGDDGERLLEQLRLCNGDIRKLVADRPREAALLYRMLEVLGIEADEIEAFVLRDLERVCAGCGAKGECRHDLDHGVAAETWQGYCENRLNLDAIRKSQRQLL